MTRPDAMRLRHLQHQLQDAARRGFGDDYVTVDQLEGAVVGVETSPAGVRLITRTEG